MSRRWIRLDVDWEDSDWLDGITGQAAGCWPRLLCWVKLRGRKGRCKKPSSSVLARRWRVPRQAVDELIEAALKDEAITIDGDHLTVTNWDQHQEADPTAAARKRRQREREADGNRHGPVTNVTRDTVTRPPTTDRDRASPSDEGDAPRARAREPNAVFGSLDELAVAAIKGMYGWADTEGTDERVWGETPSEDRPRLIRIAVQRLQGERKPYQGRLFRRILTTVVAEQLESPEDRRRDSLASVRTYYDDDDHQEAFG